MAGVSFQCQIRDKSSPSNIWSSMGFMSQAEHSAPSSLCSLGKSWFSRKPHILRFIGGLGIKLLKSLGEGETSGDAVSCSGPQSHAGQSTACLGKCMTWERPGQIGIWSRVRLQMILLQLNLVRLCCLLGCHALLALRLEGDLHLQLLEAGNQQGGLETSTVK